MIRIRLTSEQRDKLQREINMPRARWGGFQHLISRLQMGLKLRGGEWLLEMNYTDARAVLNYSAERYGEGTYQNQLRPLAADVARELECLPVGAQGSLFDE